MAEDARVVRTRKALAAALLRLLRDKSLETISVSALCAEAGMHRTTFYGHATNIEEFAIDVIAREVDAIATIQRDENDPYLPYRNATQELFVHIAQEREVYRTLLDSAWAGALYAKLDSFLQNRVRLALKRFAERGDVRIPDYREETVAFVSGGIVGVLLLWARSDDTDSRAWADRMVELMPEWWPVK